MTWVIVTQEAYEAWEATTHPTEDAGLRLAVLEWLHGLQEDGPPAEGVFEPNRNTLFVQIPETTVWMEYIVLADLTPPAIVVREFR